MRRTQVVTYCGVFVSAVALALPELIRINPKWAAAVSFLGTLVAAFGKALELPKPRRRVRRR